MSPAFDDRVLHEVVLHEIVGAIGVLLNEFQLPYLEMYATYGLLHKVVQSSGWASAVVGSSHPSPPNTRWCTTSGHNLGL
jgi:hypothetical protein